MDRTRIPRVVLLAGIAVFGAGAEPPPSLPKPMPHPKQERLPERDRLQAEAKKLSAQGKSAEAIPVVEKLLTLERKELGNDHPEVIDRLRSLAEMHQEREGFAAARPLRQEILETLIRLRGRKHWEVTDARLALAHLHRLESLDAGQRRKLAEATQLMRKANQLSGAGKPREAIEPVQQALEIRKAVLGAEHLDCAASLYELAWLHHRTGDNARAEPLCRQALEIRKQVLGEKHPHYADSLSDLATLCKAARNYAQAELLLQQVLQILRETRGEKHSDYADGLHDLATLYRSTGEYAKAEPLCRQSLAIRKEALGEKHPRYVQSLKELVGVCEGIVEQAKQREDFPAARKAGREIVALKEKLHGERHWQAIDARLALEHTECLARLDKQQRQRLAEAIRLMEKVSQLNQVGKYREAVSQAEKALAARREVLGEEHPDTATAYHWLGYLFLAAGDFKSARPHAERALAVRQKVLGEGHPNTAVSLNNLAVLYYRQRDYARSAELHRQAVEIRTRTLGATHADTLQSLRELAMALEQVAAQAEGRENFADGRQARVEVLAVRRRLYGEQHRQVTDARLALAHVEHLVRLDKDQWQRLREAKAMDGRVRALAGEGKPRSVLSLAERALATRKELLGEDDLQTLRSMELVCSLHQALGELVKAEPLLQRVMELRKRLLGEAHPDYLQTLDDLAQLYADMAKYSQAESIFRQILEIRRRILGDNHSDCVAAQKRLEDFYEKSIDRITNGSDVAAAVLVAERRLAFQREVLGGPPKLVIDSLMLLAKLHEFDENFAAAEKAHRERLALVIKLRGEDHPQASDARFALSQVQRLAKLTRDQRQQLRDAELLGHRATELAQEGKYREALEPAQKALETRKVILGEKAPMYANSLATLAAIYLKLKDYPKVEKLLCEALEIRKASLGEKHPQYADNLESLGMLYAMMSDYARAEPFYRRALEIDKVAHGETDSRYTGVLASFADMLEHWAEQHARKEDFTAARRIREELLAIRTRLRGGQHWQTIDARLALRRLERLADLTADQRRRLTEADRLQEQAMALANQDKDDEAMPLGLRAAKVRKEILGEEDSSYAVSLYLLGALSGRKQDPVQALLQTRQAAALLEKTLGEKHPYSIACLSNLGRLYQLTGDYTQAEAHLRRALVLRKEVKGENDADLVYLLDWLADLYIETGDYSRAETFCLQARKLRDEAITRGYSERVKEQGLQFLAVRYEVGRGKHDDYLLGLNRLARIYLEMGHYAQAEPLFRQVRNIRFRDPGAKHPDYARAMNNLAWLYFVMGDYDQAQPLYLQALEILEKVPRASRDYAATCNNLARLYAQTGEYNRAEQLYKKALKAFEESNGKRTLNYAVILDNLALLHANREEYAKAEELYKQALQIKKEAVGEKHSSYATSLNNLSETYQARGKLDQAEKLFRQVLEIDAAALGKKHPQYVLTLHNLALLFWKRSDYSHAEPLLRQAVETSLANLELASTVQGERQQLAMSRMLRDRLDAYLTLAPLAKQPGEAAYRHVLAWKGSVLLRQRRLRLMRQSPEFTGTRIVGVGKGKDGKEIFLIGTEGSKFEELEAVNSRLAALAFAVPDPAQKETRRRQIEALTEHKEELEAELARVGEVFRQEQEVSQLTPAGVRALLPADTVLIDFLEYTHSTPLVSGGWKKEQRLVVFVVRRDRPVEQLDLGPVAPIADAVAAWRKSISEGGGDSKDRSPAELRRLIMDRLAIHVKDARVVLVSPDGAVARLPFAALPGKVPGSYLIEEKSVAVLPVPQLLPELLKKAAPAGERSLLLVGAVDFNSDPGAPAPRESLLERLKQKGGQESTQSGELPSDKASPGASQQPNTRNSDTTPATVMKSRSAPRGVLLKWPALEATSTEMTAIRESFRKGFGQAPIRELRQKQPTENAIRQQAPKHRFLHFATHGFFAPPQLRSALATVSRLEPSTGSELFAREGVAGFHPGVLSGLVLAGANRKVSPTADDGILTALEIAAIDLSGVELATLSACETGLGEEAGGEGLLGLQRAFQAAGARSVVSGLWKVNDAATQALMSEFYRQLWEEKRSKLEALRHAQLAMLRRFDPAKGRLRGVGGESPLVPTHPPSDGRLPPLYWAAFSVSGDWR